MLFVASYIHIGTKSNNNAQVYLTILEGCVTDKSQTVKPKLVLSGLNSADFPYFSQF